MLGRIIGRILVKALVAAGAWVVSHPEEIIPIIKDAFAAKKEKEIIYTRDRRKLEGKKDER